MTPQIRYDEEHALLRAEARRWLDERFPIARVRALAESEAGEDPSDWKELAALGWLGLLVPEVHGGAGLGAVHLAVLMEETGRRLLPSPLMPSTLAALAHGARSSDAQRARWPAGDRVRRGARGPASGRRGGTERGDVLVQAALLRARPDRDDAAGVRIVPEIVSTARGAAGRVTGKTVSSSARRTPRIASRPGRALALAAEMAGGADALVAMTAAYAATREQFGKPIGSFQAVKHPLVNVLLGGRRAALALLRGGERARFDGADAETLARMAKGRLARSTSSPPRAPSSSTALRLHARLRRAASI